MADRQALEKQLNELAERVKQIEALMASPLYAEDKEYLEALYQQAKALVVKQQKASVIFLQRRLLIDMERATRILKQLEKDGVIGPEIGVQPRQILMKE